MDRDLPGALSPEFLAELKSLAELLPPHDPLAGIKNMRTNLGRALSCARDGNVQLFGAEIKHWIAEIEEFLKNTEIEDQRRRGSDE